MLGKIVRNLESPERKKCLNSSFPIAAKSCPRTNRKPGSKCIDECIPSLGCSDSKKICVCDGDCGFSCVKKGMVLASVVQKLFSLILGFI